MASDSSESYVITKKLGNLIYYWNSETKMLMKQMLPCRGMSPVCEVECADTIDFYIQKDLEDQ